MHLSKPRVFLAALAVAAAAGALALRGAPGEQASPCSSGMCRIPKQEARMKSTAPGTLIPLAHPLEAAGTGKQPLPRATFALG